MVGDYGNISSRADGGLDKCNICVKYLDFFVQFKSRLTGFPDGLSMGQKENNS